MPGAEVTVAVSDDVAVVSLHGEHDIATAPEVRRALDRELMRARDLVVDLSPASFLDSTILGVIIGARQRADQQQLGFAAVLDDGASDAVRRIIEVTGLVPLLPVLEGQQAALAHLQARAG